MHIAIVCDYFLDFVGGAQTSIREQRLALEAAGHTVVDGLARRGRRGGRGPSGEASGLTAQDGVHTARRGPAGRARRRTHRRVLADVLPRADQSTSCTCRPSSGSPTPPPPPPNASASRWCTPCTPSTGPARARLARRPLTPVMRFCAAGRHAAVHAPEAADRRPVDNLLRNLTLAMALRADTVVSPSAHQAHDLAARRGAGSGAGRAEPDQHLAAAGGAAVSRPGGASRDSSGSRGARP